MQVVARIGDREHHRCTVGGNAERLPVCGEAWRWRNRARARAQQPRQRRLRRQMRKRRQLRNREQVAAPGLATVLLLLVVSLRWQAALGMGDVKLALLLVLGLDGSALRALALGVAFAALAGILRVIRDGGTAWRASLPLAPFIAVGALIAVIA